MRRRYVYDPDLKEMVEVNLNYRQEPMGPAIFGDLPGYQSPVTGKWVDGKRARREDLKRTGSRPYEGRKIEEQIVKSRQESEDRKLDQIIEKHVVDVWQHSPERVRRVFK